MLTDPKGELTDNIQHACQKEVILKDAIQGEDEPGHLSNEDGLNDGAMSRGSFNS